MLTNMFGHRSTRFLLLASLAGALILLFWSCARQVQLGPDFVLAPDEGTLGLVGILITDNNYMELPNREKYCCREVDIVQVKGKTKVVTLYEIFDADPEPLKQQKVACLADYYQGLLYYRAMEWDKAVAAFSRSLKTFPRDPVAELYIERCILLQRQPPSPEWNGVTILEAK